MSHVDLTKSLTVQEGVDLLQPEAAAVPEQPKIVVAPTEGKNRLQKRMDTFVKRWRLEQDISHVLNAHIERYDRLTRRQKAEIRELEGALARALHLSDTHRRQRDAYREQLRQQQQGVQKPLTPDWTKPQRANYASEEEWIHALTEWRTEQQISSKGTR
jgi:hypothetical protein